MDVMYLRKSGERVLVFAYDIEHNLAAVYVPSKAASTPKNGGGWMRVKQSDLIPEEYYNKLANSFQSKTEKNKYKSRLQLVTATWRCTDGKEFDHADLELAIQHERELDDEGNEYYEGIYEDDVR